MTKTELIKELHKHGELWANEAYSKKELEDYLKGLERARNMTMEELSAYIMMEN
ncbi:MAG: hypothetical protein J6S49_06805 [Erysipelotrichaceae bacterium]|nr:hypothetical protein [Erysipelotrichaceae bacterium]